MLSKKAPEIENLLNDITKTTYKMTRVEAYNAGVCISCKQSINNMYMTELDLKEYQISCICPQCWDEIFSDGE